MENTEKVVYVDNAATTACAPEVLEVMVLVTAAAVAARELFCMERHGMVSFLVWICASYYNKRLFGGTIWNILRCALDIFSGIGFFI